MRLALFQLERGILDAQIGVPRAAAHQVVERSPRVLDLVFIQHVVDAVDFGPLGLVQGLVGIGHVGREYRSWSRRAWRARA